jgi:hypothetical protein
MHASICNVSVVGRCVASGGVAPTLGVILGHFPVTPFFDGQAAPLCRHDQFSSALNGSKFDSTKAKRTVRPKGRRFTLFVHSL